MRRGFMTTSQAHSSNPTQFSPRHRLWRYVSIKIQAHRAALLLHITHKAWFQAHQFGRHRFSGDLITHNFTNRNLSRKGTSTRSSQPTQTHTHITRTLCHHCPDFPFSLALIGQSELDVSIMGYEAIVLMMGIL